MGLQAYGASEAEAFEVEYCEGGGRRRVALDRGWCTRFEAVEPVRGFSWRKRGRGFAGWYWSATTGGHVGYESWLERDRLILLDREPGVVGIASQPFRLHWRDGSGLRRHTPDYFARLADGRGRVVAVRADDQIDGRVSEAFAATRAACVAVGWEFVRVGVPEVVLMANVRWLSRYRRPRCGARAEVAARLVEVFAEPRALWSGAEAAGDRLRVLPVLFHLLWSGALGVNLHAEVLGTGSLVWADGRRPEWGG